MLKEIVRLERLAAKQPAYLYLYDSDVDSDVRSGQWRGWATVEMGRLLTDQGKLQEALDHFVDAKKITENRDWVQRLCSQILVWADHTDQTTSLLKQGIERFREQSSWRMEAKKQRDLVALLEAYSDVPDDSKSITAQNFASYKSLITPPWELERTKRASINLLKEMAVEFQEIKQLHQATDMSLADILTPVEYANSARFGYLPLSTKGIRTFSGSLRFGFVYSDGIRELALINLERMVLIRLSLAASKLENGSYPQRLKNLVPDYLHLLPCNVFDGNEFVYEPSGLSQDVFWSAYTVRKSSVSTERITEPTAIGFIEAGKPFLLPWSSNIVRNPIRYRQDEWQNTIRSGIEVSPSSVIERFTTYGQMVDYTLPTIGATEE